MKTQEGVEKNIEDFTDEELHSAHVFLKGRIEVNVFVSELSREKTHNDFSEVDYEVKRRRTAERDAS